MLRPIRRHVKGCGNYKKWDVDCPPNTKLKCPLIIFRYETGPSGRKVRKEQALKTNDENVAWQLINQMVVSGETMPSKPPRTVPQCIDDFFDLEAKRGIQQSTLKSFHKFLDGNPNRNHSADYSPTLLEFASVQNPPIVYLKDFTPPHVANFRGTWKVVRHASQVQSERLKQFFKFCYRMKWIPENPAESLAPPNVKEKPVYAFPKEDRDALLKAVAEDALLLAFNLTMRYSALAPVDMVLLKPHFGAWQE